MKNDAHATPGKSLKVRLHTAINRADFVSRCMLYTRTKVTKRIREKMTMCFVSEPLNRIHQNTKSARLIAVCKHSFINVMCCVGSVEI